MMKIGKGKEENGETMGKNEKLNEENEKCKRKKGSKYRKKAEDCFFFFFFFLLFTFRKPI